MPRQEFSRKTRKAIIDRANGHCEVCKAVLKPGEIEVDHVLSCSLGGDNSPANGRALCKVCHKAKSASDIKKTRKADRQRDKGNGAIRPKGQIRSRGFSKSSKKSKIDKAAIDAVAIKTRGGIARQYR